MMTTMAALLGGLPLALGSGIGSELRRPLGISMVGGLIVSQVLTLYTTPVIYIFFDRLAQRFSGKHASGTRRRRPCRRTKTHEYFIAIYSSPGRHDALDGGDCACRRRGIQIPAGVAASADRFPDDFGFGAACREQARRSWLRRWPRRSSANSAASPASRK